MHSQDRDVDILDDRSREKKVRSSKTDKERRDRDKDRDRDRDRDKEKDRLRERDKESSSSSHRHRSSRSSKLRPTDSDSTSHSLRRHRTSKEKERERDKDGSERSDRKEKRSSSMADLVPELARTSLDGSRERISIPYPSFSKAHSKEYMAGKEDVSATPGRGTDPLTPMPTDLGSATMRRTKSADSPTSRRTSPRPRKETRKDDRPLTPPETDLSTEQRNGERRKDDTPATAKWQADPDTPVPSRLGGDRPRSRTASWVSRSSVSRSTSTARDDKSSTSKTSSQATFVQPPRLKTPYVESVKDNDSVVEVPSRPAGPGDAPRQRARRRPPGSTPAAPVAAVVLVDSGSDSGQDDSPRTPVQISGVPQAYMLPVDKYPPHASFEAPSEPRSEITPSATPANGVRPAPGAGPAPPPPPPPPPLLTVPEVPRVDYLMQNGGLPQPIPKNFLAVIPRLNGTRPSNPPLRGAETLFAPFFNLLDQYQTVLQSHGSVAVATGHRTVARRLLDRLENVFSRDLSPDGCSCVMCETSGELHRGLGWGEVLERVSGRIDIPSWPPFDLVSMTKTATEGIADMPPRPASPVKMDPDIAEEFREHYLRQSKRVRKAVDNWMNNMGDSPAPLPSEVDDETLNFAILTNLDQEQRPLFSALLRGTRDVTAPVIRAPTPTGKLRRNDFVVRTGLALQRLYRLKSAPRDAETVVYLVKHAHMHDLLHTISEINPSEWEILVSGRFDGFLWSGADVGGSGDDALTPTAEAPSRGVTPSFPSPAFASPGFPSPAFPSPSFPSPPGRVMSPTSGSMQQQHPGFGISRPGTNQSMSTFPSQSRGPTPFSRGATPASFVSGTSAASSAFPGAGGRPAVSNDEETEIAALAEVEREIFAGMEALEDAFELLHQRAETVRNALRQRGAGLQMSLQQRRGLFTGILGDGGEGAGVRGDWMPEQSESMASESDWGGDDQSEIAPDDSASNISSSRTRRPKRRNERRTPAPIEEEEE